MLSNTELKKLSLYELIGYTNGLALYLYDYLMDKNLWKKLSDEQDNIVSVWAEGHREQYINDRINGRCSLQAMLDFDIDICTKNTIKDYNLMKKLVKKFKLMRGYTWD